MRLQDQIDFTTLTWIKPELDETLKQARIALEAYVESGREVGELRACATYLHQVNGTLRMVELYGAAMVAEEMELLAKALLDGHIETLDDAFAALMRGIVQLPDYLERLQSGFRDIPIVLLPLLNELRSARGEKGVSESALFSPDLSVNLPASANGPAEPLAIDQLKRRAENFSQLFQTALLSWLKSDNNTTAIRDLADVCEQLVAITAAEPARRLFWVAAGTLDALAKAAFEVSRPLKQTLAKVEREIKRLALEGDAGFRSSPPLELTRQLLYYVAHAPTDQGRIGEIRRIFGLDTYLPSETEIEHARSNMSGHNRALLTTVSGAIKEDLMRVKDALDLYLRNPGEAVGQLSQQIDTLDRVADTLGMLGLGVPRRVVMDQLKALSSIDSGMSPPDEMALLDVAGALLYVEDSLDDQVNRLGAGDDSDEKSSTPLLPASEARVVVGSLANEAINNFSAARECFVAFVETHWEHSRLNDVPRLLDEVSGALRILELEEAAGYLAAIRLFTEQELIRRRRVPNGQQMDRLADALASMEYYLEAIRDRRSNHEQILALSRQSLEALGYWPLTQQQAPVVSKPVPQKPVAQAPVVSPAQDFSQTSQPSSLSFSDDDMAKQTADSSADVVVELPAVEDIPTPSMPPLSPSKDSVLTMVVSGFPQIPGFDAASDEIDDEIREVFLEEFEEEISNLDSLLPAWRNVPQQAELLRPIRRVFHTLKGSGRLVGAKALGEFSWKIENMLNRVLDGTRAASPAVIALVDQAFDVLPLLRAALQGERVYADLDGIKQIADRIAAGEEVRYDASSVEESVPVDAQVQASTPESIEEVSADSISVSSDQQQLPVFEQEPVISNLPVAPAEIYADIEEEPQYIDFSIDPVLFEILKPEVEGHLETVDQWLNACADRPVEFTDAVLRSVHTMNGAFAMTEADATTSITSPLESYVKRSISAESIPTVSQVKTVRRAVSAIRSTLTALESQRGSVPLFPVLANQLEAMRDGLPEPTSAGFTFHPDQELETSPVNATVEDLSEPAIEVIDSIDLPAFSDLPDTPIAEEIDFIDSDMAVEIEATDLREYVDTDLNAQIKSSEEFGSTDFLPSTELDAEFIDADALQDTSSVSLDEFLEPSAPSDATLAEQAQRERAEREAVELAELERQEREAAEQAQRERAEREAAELAKLAEFERQQREAAELAELERQEREAAEQAQRERAEREAAELAKLAEFERQQREAAELERQEREAAEQPQRERAEREAAQREALDQEKAEYLAKQAAQTTKEVVEPAPAIIDYASFAVNVPLAADPADAEAALDLTDIDEDLLEIFLEESNDLLDHCDGLLAKLRDRLSDNELVVGLQRDLHTLKGGARMAGMFPVGDLGHAMESLLESVAEGRRELDPTAHIVLERAFDRLHNMIARISDRKHVALPALLIGQIDALARGQALTGADAELTDSTAKPVRPEALLKPLSAPIEDVVDDDDAGALRGSQEQVRIRADLLDKLVNYAGEVAIYRARLEQQLGAFRSNLSELNQTTTRIREQLRRLEIETEAQIVARYQREGDTLDRTFDPLELDRFSTQQQLSRSLAESANDLVNLQGSMDELTRQYETLLLQQSRVSSDLQEGLMRTRMLPFESLVPRLRRVMRQACSDTGKQAQLRVDGASGEMDRNVLDRMTAPLEHMLRNAIAHGFELPQERRAAGKPAEGVLRIGVVREGSEVVLTVTDDGRGLDRDRIFAKAIERGLTKADATLTDSEIFGFILESGFSTAESVSRLAGRGVGMDVVYNEIRQLGGVLTITSEAGKGSTFTVRLPFTLAVTQAVFVKIGETTYAVPIASVEGVSRIARDRLHSNDGIVEPVRYAGDDYAIYDLGHLVGQAPAKAQDSLQMPLLLSRSGDLRAAICVDQVLGSREIVVKPVGPQINSVTGIFGATIMGDGSVVVILDVVPLVRRMLNQQRAAEGLPPAQPAPVVEKRRIPYIMVVDDSITMRKVTGRVLERHNFEVGTAKDGIDAIEKMVDRVPDLMLLDIEMPRMDGYELAQTMRGDPRLRDVPIVMITSRTGDKHRQRALELGVNRYLGKPYQEPELMRNVFELLAEVAARD